MDATAPATVTCTACGSAARLVTPRRSAARYVHVATPAAPHVVEHPAQPESFLPAAPAAEPAVSAADVALYERLLDLEHAARVTRACEGLRVGGGNVRDYRDQDRLYAATAALTPAQAAAYGAYRLTH